MSVRQGSPPGLITSRQVAELLGVSRLTVAVYCRERPGFPQPLVLSPRNHRWRRAEVEEWLEAQRRPQPRGAA